MIFGPHTKTKPHTETKSMDPRTKSKTNWPVRQNQVNFDPHAKKQVDFNLHAKTKPIPIPYTKTKLISTTHWNRVNLSPL